MTAITMGRVTVPTAARMAMIISAFAITYIIASLAWINRFVWLYTRQGTAYWHYYAWFTTALAIVFFVRHMGANVNRSLLREAVFGLSVGYVSSIVAGLGSNFGGGYGEGVAQLGRYAQSASDLLVYVFLLPLLTFGWAFAATMAIVTWCLRERSKTGFIVLGVILLQIEIAALFLNPVGARLQHIQFGAERLVLPWLR